MIQSFLIVWLDALIRVGERDGNGVISRVFGIRNGIDALRDAARN